MTPLASNTLVNERYRIINSLEQGGFGAVYEALDERLNRRVAVKQLLHQTERISRQFVREAQLLANLSHPNLPRVTDHFINSTGQYLVMDFVPGKDLANQVIDRDTYFPVPQVLGWADQLLDVLHYLHTRPIPIIHRDVKPQNIKLQPDGRIMLLDFGLAKGYAGEVEQTTGEKSLLAYTRGFAPPEQIEGSGTDARSDIYSLGATLYFLLTNEPPHEAQMRMLADIRARPDPTVPPHHLNPAVSEAVSAVLMQTLALRPDDRPASAQAFREMLRATAAPVVSPSPQPAPARNIQPTVTQTVQPSASELTQIDAPDVAAQTLEGSEAQAPTHPLTVPPTDIRTTKLSDDLGSNSVLQTNIPDTLAMMQTVTPDDKTPSKRSNRPYILIAVASFVIPLIIALAVVFMPRSDPAPANPAAAHAARANEAFVNGDTQTAIEEYDQAIALDPDNAALFTSRGDVHRTIGSDDAALDDYNRAITLDATYKVALNNRGLLYGRTGQYALAIADYDKSIELDPTNARLYFNRGNAQASIGTDESRTAALADFQKVQELSDDESMRALAQQRIAELQGY